MELLLLTLLTVNDLKIVKQLKKIYEEMGQTLRRLSSFSQYYLTSDPQFEKYFGAKATKKRKFYNGNLRTDYYQYWANKR